MVKHLHQTVHNLNVLQLYIQSLFIKIKNSSKITLFVFML